MRPIRTIAPLALGLIALAVAGCQSRPDQPPPRPDPGRAGRSHHHRAGRPGTAAQPATGQHPAQAQARPGPETVVGLWPARTLGYARTLQDGADAGHRPWLLSPELVSTAYATAQYGITDPVARKVGPAAYDVGPRNSEWVATLHPAQPVRHDAGGVWVITRTANPAGSY
jgi:hypothetical protein